MPDLPHLFEVRFFSQRPVGGDGSVALLS